MPPNQIRAFILKRVRTPNAISNIEIGGAGGGWRVIFVGGVAGVYFTLLDWAKLGWAGMGSTRLEMAGLSLAGAGSAGVRGIGLG